MLSHAPSELKKDSLQIRQKNLLKKMGHEPFILASGCDRPRNYAQQPYPFRASSHFLWLVGLNIKEAYVYSNGHELVLYVQPQSKEDLIWSGPSLGPSDFEAVTGLKTKLVSELKGVVQGAQTLAPPDADGCEKLANLLGRPIKSGLPNEHDRQLAMAMGELRIVHDEMTIGSIKVAASATEAGHRAGIKATARAKNEAVVCAAIVNEWNLLDMEPAYRPIVTTHGEILHCETYSNPLKKGDLVLVDAGAQSHLGISTDVTRVWPVTGKFSSTQRAFYDIVLNAQAEAIAACKPGVAYREIHLTACRAITRGLIDLDIFKGDVDSIVQDGLHAVFFPHGVGHLLGYDTHDAKDLGDMLTYDPKRPRSTQFGLNYLRLDRDLVPGMMVTIEPGLYQIPALLEDPQWRKRLDGVVDFAELSKYSDTRGIRIEDDVLITATGTEVLTQGIPKAPLDIEKMVLAGAH